MYILHIKIVLNNNLYHTAFRKAEEPAERGAVESCHLPIKCLFHKGLVKFLNGTKSY